MSASGNVGSLEVSCWHLQIRIRKIGAGGKRGARINDEPARLLLRVTLMGFFDLLTRSALGRTIYSMAALEIAPHGKGKGHSPETTSGFCGQAVARKPEQEGV